MYFASLVAAAAAMYLASHDDWAISDCVRAPVLINAPSGIVNHEERTFEWVDPTPNRCQ